MSDKNHLATTMDEETRTIICSLVDQIEQKRLYRGKGGEIMRAGVCHLIHAQATANIVFDSKSLQQMFTTLQENLRHPNMEIQEAAAKGFESYCNSYFNKTMPACADEEMFEWLKKEI